MEILDLVVLHSLEVGQQALFELPIKDPRAGSPPHLLDANKDYSKIGPSWRCPTQITYLEALGGVGFEYCPGHLHFPLWNFLGHWPLVEPLMPHLWVTFPLDYATCVA